MPVVYRPTLTHLRLILTGNVMLSEGVNVLLEALHPHGQSLSHLRAFSLNLTDTGLGDASVSFLAALLFASHEAPANVSLHLQNNALSHSGLVYLLIDGLGDTAQRPIQWRCLTLDVGDNQIHLTVTGFGSPAPPPKKKKCAGSVPACAYLKKKRGPRNVRINQCDNQEKKLGNSAQISMHP